MTTSIKATNLTLKPSEQAESSITSGLALLPPNVKSFFSPLCLEILRLRIKRNDKENSFKQFEDPEYMPRSVRLNIKLGFTAESLLHADSLVLQDEMKALILDFQFKARATIMNAAKLEIDVMIESTGEKFLNLLIHSIKTILVLESMPCTDQLIKAIATKAIKHLDIRNHIQSKECLQLHLDSRFPSETRSIPDFLEDYTPPQQIRFRRIFEANGALQKSMFNMVTVPWTTYLEATALLDQQNSLKVYFKEQRVTAATEATTIRIDTNPDTRDKTVQTIVDVALAKQAKNFERLHKNLSNTVKQLSSKRKTKNVPSGGSKGTASAKNKNPTSATPNDKAKKPTQKKKSKVPVPAEEKKIAVKPAKKRKSSPDSAVKIQPKKKASKKN